MVESASRGGGRGVGCLPGPGGQGVSAWSQGGLPGLRGLPGPGGCLPGARGVSAWAGGVGVSLVRGGIWHPSMQ